MELRLATEKVKAVRVEFPWSEAGFQKVAFNGLNVWRQASEFLRGKAWNAPAHGGCNKTDFKITFEDGNTYEGHFDLVHPERGLADLSEHVLEFQEFYAGCVESKDLPSHISPEDYERLLARDPKGGELAREFLDAYEVGDEEPNEVSPSEGQSEVPYDRPKEPEPEPEPVFDFELTPDKDGPEVRTKKKGVTTVHNIHPGHYTMYGKKEARTRYSDTIYCAEITPKKSVRIYGVYGNTLKDGGIKFDKTFKLGDIAVYDSYNLTYTGEIVGIGPKSVSIRPYPNSGAKRLDLNTFCWRNWNLDLEKIAYQNSETMMTI